MKKLALASIFFSTQIFAQVFVDSGIQLSGKDTIVDLDYVTGAAAWGDYDKDGDQDVFVSGNLYRNDGNKTFVEIQTNITGFGEAKWGDYDNDGDLDLLRPANIFRNDSIHGFTNIQAGLANIDCGMVDWGDYDNDGDLDAVVGGGCSINSGTAKIYRNDGLDAFTALSINLTNTYYTNVEWGDFDKDLDLDLLYGNQLYLNNGNDVFVAHLTIPGGLRTAWVDYDGDNDLDISITGDGDTKIYENNNNSFTDSGVKLTINYDNMGNLIWGDYDNDGDQDVFITRDYSYYASFEIYKNVSKGVFVQVLDDIALNYGFAGWGDYDGDNDLDVVVHGVFSESGIISKCDLKIYENTTFVGLKELETNHFINIYPNPTNDKLLVSTEELGLLEVYNATGQLVEKFALDQIKTSISVVNYSEGIYFLKLSNTNGISVSQFVVKK